MCVAFAAAAAPPPPATAPSADGFLADLRPSELILVVQTARRTYEAVALGRPTPPVGYRPPRLEGRRAIVHVSVRRFGKIMGEGESAETDLLEGASFAAEQAARAVPAGDPAITESVLGRTAIEVELVGPATMVPYTFDEKLHFVPELYAAFQPGIDGIGVTLDRRIGRCRPSTVLAAGYNPTLALQHAESMAGFTSTTKQEHHAAIRYFRFPTIHLWQPDPYSRPILLRRGLVPVAAADVTAEALDAAVDQLMRHMLKRRKRDAWLAFEYAPAMERFSELDSLSGQFTAAWALGRFGQQSGRKECVESAARIIAAAQSFAVPFQADLPARAIVATSEAPPLATTALYLSCLSRFPSAEYTLNGGELADAIRLVQKPEGRFENAFPPDVPSPGQAYSAAIATLALLEHAKGRPNADVEQRLRSAVRFYANYFRSAPDRALATWLAPAMVRAYEWRPDPPVSDLLLAVGDWLCERQVQTEPATAPEFVGAFLDLPDTPADAANAGCLAALCDAHDMARRLGDAPRSARYDGAIRLAARFVMQLQFRPQECYYVGGPAEVVGAVRHSLWDHRLRADDSAMALWALARAREALYGAVRH